MVTISKWTYIFEWSHNAWLIGVNLKHGHQKYICLNLQNILTILDSKVKIRIGAQYDPFESYTRRGIYMAMSTLRIVSHSLSVSYHNDSNFRW